MQDLPTTKRHFWRNALALLCGILTGVVLSVAEPMWRLLQMWLRDQPIETGTYGFWAILYVGVPVIGGGLIALVATAIWWALGKTARRHLSNALGLGFVLGGTGTALWFAYTGTDFAFDRRFLLTFAVYGFDGAAAGAVTWWISHPHRENLFIVLD
jgi:hypothetical protein